MARSDTQLNIRLPQARRDVLDAAALVHRKGTANRLAQEIVDSAIDRYGDSPTVKAALQALREQDATDSGTLARLPRKRDPVRKSRGGGET